jgi:hypothetical protein
VRGRRTTMPRRSGRAGVTDRGTWRALIVVAALVVVAVATPTVVVAASRADGPPGSAIGVEVLDESGSPTPAPSSTLPTLALDDGDTWPFSSGGRGGSTDAVDGVTVGSPVPVPSASGPAASGLLELGGLRALGWPTWDPFDSTVHVSLTIRNGLAATVGARVRFELRTVAGQHLGRSGSYRIAGLQPGESRQVEADLHGAGQSTLVQVVSLVTPITDDPTLSSRTFARDTWALVPPWLLIVILAALAGAVVAVWVVRRNRRAAS